jgi:fatty-acyl-CoA synthase
VQHGYIDYEDWLKRASGNFKPPALSENDGASMCYTSGTTGNPKGVLYSHRSQVLHSMSQAMADSCAFSQHDTVLLASPMFHANGWGFSYTAAMVGAKYVLPGPHLDAESLLELIERENVTMTCAVPTVWLGVLQTLEKRRNWKPEREVRILCGGTAPPESLIRNLDLYGFHVIHSWGMTETSPQATASRLPPAALQLPQDQQYAMRSKQGWPLPFVDVRIRAGRGLPEAITTRRKRTTAGPPTAGSAPATSPRWTPTAASSWWTAAKISSSPAVSGSALWILRIL